MSVRYKIRDQHGLNYLTCSIVGWVDLFSRQVYRDMVLDSWRYCQEHKGLQIHAYTIMSNHLHLIASCLAPYQLEATMRDWKHYTATKILDYLEDTTQPESRREWLLYLFSYFAVGRKDKQTHQIWHHDNHPIELYSEHVISQKMDYIHLNAVRAGLVALPEHWAYSSARFYASTSADVPSSIESYPSWVEIVPIWQWLDEAEARGVKRVEPER